MENLFRDLAVSAGETAREEEALRTAVRELPDSARVAYYDRLSPRLRDPDTYAVLNWMFVGVHHIYLGRWLRGALNLTLVIASLLMIFASDTGGVALAGIAILVAVAFIELIQLFRSQTIVADYNNRQAREVLRQLA